MSFPFPELLSGLACFLFCVLLAAIGVRAKVRVLLERVSVYESGLPVIAESITQPAPNNHIQDKRLAVSMTSSAVLFAFLWLPLGSLPPLFSFSWGALALLGSLAVATGLEGGWHWDGVTRRKTLVLAWLAFSLMFFAWYARQRGVPGELFSLDSYVVTPLADIMGWQGKFGMLLLALAFLLALRGVQQDLASGLVRIARLEGDEARTTIILALVRQIWIFAVLGVAVCLFVPFCPAGRLGMSGVTGIVTDVLTFWLKVLIADYALWLTPQLFARLPWVQVPLVGLGVLCIFFA